LHLEPYGDAASDTYRYENNDHFSTRPRKPVSSPTGIVGHHPELTDTAIKLQ